MIAVGAGLCCPKCGSTELTVTDSRAFQGGIRRRRKCLKCAEWNRFSTIEVPLNAEEEHQKRVPIIRALELLGQVDKLPVSKREIVLALIAEFTAEEST